MQVNMTSGLPVRVITVYALPLFIGNLFQQLYSIVDAVILGRFVGKEGLAAVGSSSSIMTLINSIIIGLCMGASIVVSRHYGAQNRDYLQKTLSASFVFVMGFTFILAVLTQLFIRPLLAAYRMPGEIRVDAEAYLRILFLGMFCTCLYNSVAYLLRAVGDSRAPLIFLAISMLLNIALDLIFVLAFHMNIRGVALATVLSQGMAALCAARYAYARLDFLHMRWRPHFQPGIFGPIARYSILTCLQQAVMNFGGVLVSGLVNSFGVAAIAAFTSCGRIDTFNNLPTQDFGNALMTFTAQNAGAGKSDRIRAGLRFAITSVAIYSGVLSIIVVLFSRPLLALFVGSNETQVLDIGVRYLTIVGCFYVLIGILTLFYSYYRGIGKPHISLILSVISLGTRVAVSYALAAALNDINNIWWAIPLGWGLADFTGFLVYLRTKSSLPASRMDG